MGESEHAFEALLDYLKRSRGVDLTGYKRPGLMRRFDRLMTVASIENYADYISYLEASPGEIGRLLDTILINVTGFFRDMPAWDILQKEAIPHFLSGKKLDDAIRVWSAGCASGEEPYTIAVILAEAIGVDAVRDRVKIHATDLDEDALAYARGALYTERELQWVPENLQEKYFERSNGRFAFDKNLRRSVIFGRHDLVQDVPISRLDLLVCRNTLMYFNAEMQSRILSRFHFALNPGGFLMLGKAEMLVGRNSLFVPLDLRRRVFVKEHNGNDRNLTFFPPELSEEEGMSRSSTLTEVAFQASPLAQVIVSTEGALVFASERARVLFRLTPRDIGRPFQDLAMSYQLVELRACMEKSSKDRHPMAIKGVVWGHRENEANIYDVHVSPLVSGGALVGVSVSFIDISDHKRLQEELEASNHELAEAYEEAQAANEELETMNEELQSSAEELETTNEEIQSTNEELETINEELQSSAEELETTNEELRARSLELARLSEFLESLMSSLPGGLAVVGPDLEIQAWNHKAEDLWGIRSDETVGKNLMSLDIGVPVEKLYPLVRACLTGTSPLEEVTLDATNRRGRAIACKISCMPVIHREAVRGAMLFMNTVL